MISRPVLCTREDVARATDTRETARNSAQVDRAIEAAADAVLGLLHRSFHPWTGTRTFDWPDVNRARSWRLWLNQHELVSVTSITSGGVALAPGEYFLRPDHGPPHTHVEINLGGPAAWSAGDTHQRAISITGTFGYRADSAAAGLLAEELDASETGVDVTNGALVGVGDLVQVDAERMLVTGRQMLDTGQALTGAVASSAGATSVPVDSGAAFAADEVILIGVERMLIVDIAGNNLVVKRAWDGSVLAAHDPAADVYASRTLIVQRGVLGTTAAAHDIAAAVSRHVVPGLVRQLAVAEAVTQLAQEGAGWARVAGGGDSERETSGRGVAILREQAYTAYGRKARKRAV